MKPLIRLGLCLGLLCLASCAADIGDPGSEHADHQSNELGEGTAPEDPAASPEGDLGGGAVQPVASDPGGPTPNPWQPEAYDDPDGPTPNPWAKTSGSGSAGDTSDEEGNTGTQGAKTSH